jgi:hypothetical protein
MTISSDVLLSGASDTHDRNLTPWLALILMADGATRASLGTLPLSLVPTFAVPLWIIFHVISLLQVRRARTTSVPATGAMQ